MRVGDPGKVGARVCSAFVRGACLTWRAGHGRLDGLPRECCRLHHRRGRVCSRAGSVANPIGTAAAVLRLSVLGSPASGESFINSVVAALTDEIGNKCVRAFFVAAEAVSVVVWRSLVIVWAIGGCYVAGTTRPPSRIPWRRSGSNILKVRYVAYIVYVA